MRILIVEDNQKKLDKLKEYISKEFPDYEITDRQSYNSATKEIVLNYKNYDLMLLDMSMQTYDISEDEMGGEPGATCRY
ncbi:response regulator [Bacteroides thetaiotaomicron]|nr:response regulator [Bacteroides thetaiotaomicron]